MPNPKDAEAAVKVPMTLCPPVLRIAVAAVMRNALAKPGRYAWNWRDNDVSLSFYLDAIHRHLAKLEDGEWTDQETGEPHIAMVAANCAIILDSNAVGTLKVDTAQKDAGIHEILTEYNDLYKEEEKLQVG